MKKTSLYRYFSATGQLLYVGISHHPLLREVQHGHEKQMSTVASITLDWYGKRTAARRAELIAIKKEKPLWNVAETKPKKPQKKYKPRPVIDYDARLKSALDEFNSLPFCEQVRQSVVTAT